MATHGVNSTAPARELQRASLQACRESGLSADLLAYGFVVNKATIVSRMLPTKPAAEMGNY